MKRPKVHRGVSAFAALWLVGLATGCSDSLQQAGTEGANETPAGLLVSDAESSLRAELIQADRDFAQRVRSGGLESWVTAFDDDGMVLPADGPIAVGSEAIRDLFSPLFAEPNFKMSWEPVGSQVGDSGDLGFTFGNWRTSTGTANVDLEQAEGKYVTVWRKGPGGRWRVLADIGNQQPKAIDSD